MSLMSHEVSTETSRSPSLDHFLWSNFLFVTTQKRPIKQNGRAYEQNSNLFSLIDLFLNGEIWCVYYSDEKNDLLKRRVLLAIHFILALNNGYANLQNKKLSSSLAQLIDVQNTTP